VAQILPDIGPGTPAIFSIESRRAERALGYIDMRKGIDGLAMLVQGVLYQDPVRGLDTQSF
jgi:hypothetical protein